ncbi:Glutamine amidotransferase subunit PdxT [Candidatus Rubidus massiliensis]|nr:Glutamine amidotransferase subunit PdxT [Candidatus Rubidus massiliensis]
MIVGVLSVQGAFAKHIEALQKLGIRTKQVKTPHDLIECNGLIIPGGESTTILRQLKFINLLEPLHEFAKSKPILGTCAGLILMSKHVLCKSVETLQLLDIEVERNAFGRQVESFSTEIEFKVPHKRVNIIPAVFIRAPRIRKVSKDVLVLAEYNQEPILVQQGIHLGATFHPELTDSLIIHNYFCNTLKDR